MLTEVYPEAMGGAGFGLGGEMQTPSRRCRMPCAPKKMVRTQVYKNFLQHFCKKFWDRFLTRIFRCFFFFWDDVAVKGQCWPYNTQMLEVKDLIFFSVDGALYLRFTIPCFRRHVFCIISSVWHENPCRKGVCQFVANVVQFLLRIYEPCLCVSFFLVVVSHIYIFYFQPENWGNEPIWRAYFSDGLKLNHQPACLCASCVSFLLAHLSLALFP